MRAAPLTFEKYGAWWPKGSDPLQIELACIAAGGSWKNKRGQTCGLGLWQHYQNFHKIVWPKLDNHRWNIHGAKC